MLLSVSIFNFGSKYSYGPQKCPTISTNILDFTYSKPINGQSVFQIRTLSDWKPNIFPIMLILRETEAYLYPLNFALTAPVQELGPVASVIWILLQLTVPLDKHKVDIFL